MASEPFRSASPAWIRFVVDHAGVVDRPEPDAEAARGGERYNFEAILEKCIDDRRDAELRSLLRQQ